MLSTRLTCGQFFNDHFVANLPLSVRTTDFC